MKKAIIVGCPGSGKSTFANELHNIIKLPLYHLDMLNWNSDKTTVGKEIFKKRLHEIVQQDTWIIDGNYGSTIELRLQACDTVFFLDYTVDVCLEGIKMRKGKQRNDIPWIESLDEEDEEFIKFVKNYNFESRPLVMNLLNKYSDKNIFTFTSRDEADKFLSSLKLNNFLL